MTRRWTYLPIAAAGIVGVTVGILDVARRDRGLHEFDWGNPVVLGDGASSLTVNMVRVVAPFDADERRFSYYTGGYSPGSGEASAAPASVVAEGAHGVVAVRLLAFEPSTRERADAGAVEIARAVSLVTTRVWPAEPTPVRVDVHVMPHGAPFSLAKRVDWQEGDAYEIAMFAGDELLASSTAVHELYHALAGRWSLGNKDPANSSRPNAARAYEEVTANLFAACGRLLATGSLSPDTRSAAVTIAGQRFEGVLDGDELGRALDLISRDAPGSHVLADLLARTVLADALGGRDSIALESPEGEELLARCREPAANPMHLSFRLASMLRTSASQAEPRALGD